MRIERFKVEEWFNEYEKQAKYNLADTCIESMSIDELLQISSEQLLPILSTKMGYGAIQGSDRLKTAILSLYDSKHPLTVTHGAIGANQLVYLSLIEREDEVISILPAYQQHYSIPESIGAKVKKLFLKPENNWLPDLEELRAIVTEKTKLITLTNPNNPTGSVIEDDMMKEIINIANGAYILADEVYRGLGEIKTTSIADLYENGVSVGSMSKCFSLAGLRVGWIVGNDKVIEEVNHQREYNTISVSILDDYLASIALENKEKILERNLEKRRIGLGVLKNWLAKNPDIDCVLPNGGTTALIKYNKDIPSIELCKDLLKDTGVLFLPASTLEMEGYLRLGYGNNPEGLKTGLDLFADWL